MKKKHWVMLGLLGLGIFAAVATAKAEGTNTNTSDEILITNHDANYDYKFSAGRWYTRRKGAEVWIDMQTALSKENYDLAVSRLTNFLNS